MSTSNEKRLPIEEHHIKNYSKKKSIFDFTVDLHQQFWLLQACHYEAELLWQRLI